MDESKKQNQDVRLVRVIQVSYSKIIDGKETLVCEYWSADGVKIGQILKTKREIH